MGGGFEGYFAEVWVVKKLYKGVPLAWVKWGYTYMLRDCAWHEVKKAIDDGS